MEDALLKERILAAIEWESGVDVAATGVSVAEGIVRLFGNVGTSTERQVLERVGQGVCGVAALTNDLDVRAWRAYRSEARGGCQPHTSHTEAGRRTRKGALVTRPSSRNSLSLQRQLTTTLDQIWAPRRSVLIGSRSEKRGPDDQGLVVPGRRQGPTVRLRSRERS